MTARPLLLRYADARIDALHCKDSDPVLARALGLILSGCVILGWIVLRLIPKQIGA